MASRDRIKRNFSQSLGYLFIVLVTIIWLLPIIWMIISGFRDPAEPFYLGIIPQNPTLVNFAKVITNKATLRSFLNSFVVASSVAVFTLIIGSLAAYGFSRFTFSGKNTFSVLLLVIRLFPGVLLALALFQVAGIFDVYDTYAPLILANGLLLLPFTVWNLRTMFQTLPVELEEAAWIDGASRLGGITKVLLPLMAPGLAATGAFVFLLTWNEYLFAVSFIRSPEKQLITTAIAANIGQYNIDFTGLIATGMLASVPLLIIFLLIQRYIISGLGMGAFK